MNKFYLFPISWILLNPCFAEIASDRIAHEYKQLENPQLVIELASLKKDSASETQVLDNRTTKKASEANKKTIADAQNAPAVGVALGLNPQLLEEHVVKIPKDKQQKAKAVAEKNHSSTNQEKVKASQALRKKELHKKRSISRDEKQLPSKKRNFSERLSSRKKSTQSLRQDKQLATKRKKYSNVLKNQQMAKPSPKSSQNIAESKKPFPSPTAKETLQKKDQTAKQENALQNDANADDKKREQKIYNSHERTGKYFIPSTRKESLASKNQIPSVELSEKKIAEGQINSLNQNADKKESLNTSQKQLNSEETSFTYDRYISRQNHHSMSEDTSQSNDSTEEGTGRKSNVQSHQKNRDLKQSAFTEPLQDQQENASFAGPPPAPKKLSDTHSLQFYPKKCRSPFHVMHVGLRHMEAKGVGYRDGYTTLEGFGIYNGNTYFMPFIDLRGHVFDHGKLAGNAGMGGRSFFSSIEHVFGYYLYYDVRQDSHHLTAQQLSPGIELLGKRMEYRMNGYFPMGNQKSHKYDFDFDAFDGHHIVLKAKQRYAMIGGDAEIGAHITQSTKYDLYAGVGPYYFSSSHASSWGGKARLLGRFKEYVSLEATYTYDHLFGSVIQGSVAINLPFGKRLQRKGKDCSSQVNLALSRAAFSPYRFEIPVIKKISRKQKAINPATNDPWKVWFVNNTSHSDGTFESPFPTLVQAQNASGPNDMIYVFPGDGTTTGMDMGILLQEGQKLFGSGIAHKIKTTKGKIKIPAFSNRFPMITNTGGNVVTLGNGDQVSGMNILITALNSFGIRGDSINGATINNNMISGIDFGGVHIVGSGIVKVKNNQIINLSPSHTNSGINIQVQDAMKANISNNTINGFIDGIDFGPRSNSPTTAQTDAIIKNNLISNFRNDGIFYFTGMPNSTVRIIGNVINNTVGVELGSTAAISVSVNNSPNSGTVRIQNNTITTTTTNPNVIGILAEINAPTGVHLNVDINHNIVATGSGAGSVGIDVRTTADNATICASITDNTVTLQAAGTHDFQITTNVPGATNSVIDIVDDFPGGSNIEITGNVHFVPAGTCD
jgi:hypothetical protein